MKNSNVVSIIFDIGDYEAAEEKILEASDQRVMEALDFISTDVFSRCIENGGDVDALMETMKSQLVKSRDDAMISADVDE